MTPMEIIALVVFVLAAGVGIGWLLKAAAPSSEETALKAVQFATAELAAHLQPKDPVAAAEAAARRLATIEAIKANVAKL